MNKKKVKAKPDKKVKKRVNKKRVFSTPESIMDINKEIAAKTYMFMAHEIEKVHKIAVVSFFSKVNVALAVAASVLNYGVKAGAFTYPGALCAVDLVERLTDMGKEVKKYLEEKEKETGKAKK